MDEHSQKGVELSPSALMNDLGEYAQRLAYASNYSDLFQHFIWVLKCLRKLDDFAVFEVKTVGSRISLFPMKFMCGRSQVHLSTQSEFIQALLSNRLKFGCERQPFEIMEYSGLRYCLSLIGDVKVKAFVWIWSMGEASTIGDAETLVVQMLRNELNWHFKSDYSHALVYKDELTKLYNYRYLDFAVDNEIARASRYGRKFSILFIDLDEFKKINDQYGHILGNELLKEVSKALVLELRDADIIIRYGGDELVVLLVNTELDQAVPVAQRLLGLIKEARVRVEGLDVHTTATIGISSYPEHGTDKESLLKFADDLMFKGKREGKDQIVWNRRSISKPSSKKNKITTSYTSFNRSINVSDLD